MEGLNTVARLGVAAGLLLIGYEMHTANAPTHSAADVAPAFYLQTAASSEDTKKPPVTITNIDADLRQINATLAGITVAIGEAGWARR